MNYALGVDLGTTYTAAAVRVDGRAQIVRLGSRRAEIPSLVFMREDGVVLVGDAAERRGADEPVRLAREFKRRLGDPVPVLVGGSPYSAHALMARVLEHVYRTVVRQQEGPPSIVCVTHPANWGPYKRELLTQAVQMADVPDVQLRPEPEAAAVQYAAQERVRPGEIIAVYDLGGGTFDAAVLRKTDTGFEVLGEPAGIEQLGGVDFDEAVLNHVMEVLGSRVDGLDPEDPAVREALVQLRRDCVTAKEDLSDDTEVLVPVALPSLHTRVRLNRSEFEAMIGPVLVETTQALRRALRSAEVSAGDLRSILLAGGSSRIPLVSEVLSTQFERPLALDGDPAHNVALGAALAAGVASAPRRAAVRAPAGTARGRSPAAQGAGPGGAAVVTTAAPATTAQAATSQAGAAQAEAAQAERARTEAARTEATGTEAARAQAAQAGTAQAGTAQAGAAQAGAAKTEAARTGATSAETARTGPTTAGATTAGAVTAGATTAGATTAGATTAGAVTAGATTAGAARAGVAKAGAVEADATKTGTAKDGAAKAGTAQAPSPQPVVNGVAPRSAGAAVSQRDHDPAPPPIFAAGRATPPAGTATPPAGTAAPPEEPGGTAKRGRARGSLAAGAAAVAVLLVVGVAWVLTRDEGGPEQGGAAAVPAAAWKRLADLPVPVDSAAVAAYQGKIWVAGGLTNNGDTKLTSTYVYDPATDKWSEGPELPRPISHAALVATPWNLYFLAGWIQAGGSKQVLKLSADQSAWEQDVDLPENRVDGAAAFDGTGILFAGGSRPGGVASDAIFSLRDGAWKQVGKLSVPRQKLSATTNNVDTVWFLGGRRIDSDVTYGNVDQVTSNKVAPPPPGGQAPIDPPTDSGAAVFVDGSGMCLVGGKSPGNVFQSWWCNQPGGAAKLPKLSPPRAGLGAARIGRTVYIVGGYSATVQGTTMVESYTPPPS